MANRKAVPSVSAPDHGTRWTGVEARRFLDEWATSGMSLTAFARDRGLHPQRLSWWRKRLAHTTHATVAPPTFIPVTVRVPDREPVAAVLELGGSIRVELRALDAASAAWVAALARALGAAS